MKSFYEKNREEDKKIIIQRNTSHHFKAHFHLNLEIFIIKRGNYKLFINGKSYFLSNGDIALIDSYDIHSYEGDFKQDDDDLVLIFPVEYTNLFKLIKNNSFCETPILHNEKLASEIIEINDRILAVCSDKIIINGALNLLFSLIVANFVFVKDNENLSDNLMKNILQYIIKNYTKDINLNNISKELGYSREYISRVFHHYMNCNISSYINELRLDYIKNNKSKGKKLSDLIFEAGFNSIQTYYRSVAKQKF